MPNCSPPTCTKATCKCAASPMCTLPISPKLSYRTHSSSARFLWKRIPSATKTAADPIDLAQIWLVYQALWLNDVPAFCAAVQFEWTVSAVAELMAELKERVLHETIDLIATAYSSIYEDRLAHMVQLDPAVVEDTCKALGWVFEEGPSPRLVRPQRRDAGDSVGVCAEAQLAKLTDFVSFLEN